MRYLCARVLASSAGIGICCAVASAQITIPTVTIGNPGNAADPTTGFGSVSYTYDIGQTEVTNAQYAAFLNAIAATDTNGVYIAAMGDSGGIIRSGSSGSYTYAAVSGLESHPVNFISFWDATRFANWLHNGQPAGNQDSSTTEDGAYTLTAGGISANTITRNVGWQWAVTTEDEWYKAAYHQPASQGGDTDDFWLYPTSGNTVNTSQANYGPVPGTTTAVGSYAANFYGTFDMGGNVFEWNESIFAGSSRVLRGGSFSNFDGLMRADNRNIFHPSNKFSAIGFRLSRAFQSPPCVADYNDEGDAGDILDFLDFFDDFSACDGQAAPCGIYGDSDINGDTVVDILDFLDFLDAFGQGC